MLRSSTRLQSSPKKFRVGDIAKLRSSEIVLRDMSSMKDLECECQSSEDGRSYQSFGRINQARCNFSGLQFGSKADVVGDRCRFHHRGKFVSFQL